MTWGSYVFVWPTTVFFDQPCHENPWSADWSCHAAWSRFQATHHVHCVAEPDAAGEVHHRPTQDKVKRLCHWSASLVWGLWVRGEMGTCTNVFKSKHNSKSIQKHIDIYDSLPTAWPPTPILWLACLQRTAPHEYSLTPTSEVGWRTRGWPKSVIPCLQVN